MTSITSNVFSGGYYTLPTADTTSGTGSTSTDNSSAPASSVNTGLTTAQNVGGLLLAAEAASAAGNPIDPISLSTQAQNFLSQSAGTSDPDTNFHLSAAQQQQVQTILKQFQTAPNTQDTFNAVQDALKDAGLSPAALAGADLQASLTASQTKEALGNTGNANGIGDETTKANNFIASIYQQFQVLQSVAATGQATDTTA